MLREKMIEEKNYQMAMQQFLSQAPKMLKDLEQNIPVARNFMAGSVFVDTNVLIYSRDALIISAAQDADCQYLLSEDLQDTQMFDKLKVVNPFHTLPESLIM